MDACANALLTRMSDLDVAPIIAQRLKRLPRIVEKIEQFAGMKVARMQDIAGVRAIVRSVADVDHVVASFQDAPNETLTITRTDNYILNPKDNGYRSVHLVFKYKGTTPSAYDGLSVELQIRTEWQHLWASAVETAGMWTGQRIKYDQGDPEWTMFFSLAAEVIARHETSHRSDAFETISDEDLRTDMREIEFELNALNLLREGARQLEIVETGVDTLSDQERSYRLLTLEPQKDRLAIQGFSGDAQASASAAYADAEQKATFTEDGVGPVLVCVNAQDHLRRAYRSFYLDTIPFANVIDGFLQGDNAQV